MRLMLFHGVLCLAYCMYTEYQCAIHLLLELIEIYLVVDFQHLMDKLICMSPNTVSDLQNDVDALEV